MRSGVAWSSGYWRKTRGRAGRCGRFWRRLGASLAPVRPARCNVTSTGALLSLLAADSAIGF